MPKGRKRKEEAQDPRPIKHTVLTYDPDEWNQFWGAVDAAKPGSRNAFQLEANREAYMNWLYERDGRDDPSHPQHSTWTGLAIAHREELLKEALEKWAMDIQRSQILFFDKEESKKKYYGCHQVQYAPSKSQEIQSETAPSEHPAADAAGGGPAEVEGGVRAA